MAARGGCDATNLLKLLRLNNLLVENSLHGGSALSQLLAEAKGGQQQGCDSRLRKRLRAWSIADEDRAVLGVLAGQAVATLHERGVERHHVEEGAKAELLLQQP